MDISNDPSFAYDDATLLRIFEDGSIPRDHWTHAAHVRVAFTYLTAHSFDQSLERMRQMLLHFSEVKKIKPAPGEGYHETITIAFMHLVVATIANNGMSIDSKEFVRANLKLLSKNALNGYYSEARLKSPEAQQCWVEPDLSPLPTQRPQD